jgi:hypothetical protein
MVTYAEMAYIGKETVTVVSASQLLPGGTEDTD